MTTGGEEKNRFGIHLITSGINKIMHMDTGGKIRISNTNG